MNQTIRKIEDILTSQYNITSYTDLIREIFPSVKIIAPDRFMKEYTNFSSHIEGYAHVGNYTDPDGKNLIIHAVQLKKESYVENSRSTQRSYAKKLIEAGNADAAIVAFYTEDDPKWRLSFVRLDYEIKFENGKLNTTENMTPAKRYSYLVGQDEPCHTAISRFYRFITDDPNVAQPSLDDLEEAFSVEKVTEEFFQLYCEKFHQLRESLDANEDFVTEAKEHNFTSAQFAKKLMGQIVFLYFLQKKGWMGVGAWTSPLTKKQYDNVFFTQGAKGRVIKEYLPKVFVQTGVDEYKLNVRALDEIPDDAEEIIANQLPGRKTWGSGSKQFMRGLFNVSQKKGGNFFDDYLEPLFYDALNVNRGEQGYDPTLHCRIPFLSGGLFEPIDGYDWKHNDFAIPNEIFSNKKDENDRNADGILDIFDRYNFTMSEDEPLEREVAIDPEMLGKVFENLLEVKDRKSKGAFYTPREIVHYMCQEALISYLIKETGLKEQDIRDFILLGDFLKDEDTVKERRQGEHDMFISEDIYKIDKEGKVVVNRLTDIDDALASVRVADPAVGSGAFPLGMLNEIVRARQNISAYMAITQNAYETRMMYNNERSPYNLKLQTIKNCIFASDIEPSAVDIAQLRLWLSLVIDDEINPEAQSPLDGHRNPIPLPNLECNIVCGNSLIDEFEGIKLVNFSDAISTSRKNQQQNLFQNAFDAILPALLEAQDALFRCDDAVRKQELKERIEALKDEIVKSQMQVATSETKDRYKASQKAASKPFVLWQLDFARVFKEKGGFDIVLGNPPYVSAVTGASDSKTRAVLRKKYKELTGAFDLYVAFLLLGLEISNEKGIYSWIIPNKVLVSKYANKTVDKLSKNGLYRIVSVSEINVFHNVGVYPIIIHGDKTDEREGFEELYTDKIENIGARIFYEKKKLDDYETFADKGIKFSSGATGFQAQLIKEYITEDMDKEGSIPFIVSGCVDPFSYDNSVVRYMKSVYSQPRVVQGEGIADSKWRFWNEPKIVVAGMTKIIESVYIEEPMALGVGVYAIFDFGGYNPKSLSAVLNSSFMTDYIVTKFKEKHLAGGYLAINKNTLEKLPLVDIPKETQDLLAGYYDSIVENKKLDKDISLYLDEINKIVDQLYDKHQK